MTVRARRRVLSDALRFAACADPNEDTRAAVTAVVQGVRHLLRSGGVFISMTFNQPHFRKPLLAACGALAVKQHKHVELGFKDCYVFHLTVPMAAPTDAK